MRKKHISTEIFTYVSIGFLLIILLLCGGFLLHQKKIIQEKINVSITGLLNQTSNAINDTLCRAESLIRYFIVNDTLIESLEQPPDYQYSRAVDKMFSDLGNSHIWTGEYITIVGKKGQIFVNWENDGGRRYSDGMKALNERLYDEEDSLREITFERYVNYDNLDQFDKNKKLAGVASLIYSTQNVNEVLGVINVSVSEKSLLSIMEKNNVYDGSLICLMNREGDVLLSTIPEMRGTVIDISQAGWKPDSIQAGNCILDYQGSSMMAFYQPLNTDWIQMILIPYPIYMNEIRMLMLVFAGITVLAVVLALIISTAISYSISKPIKELERSIDLITNGELQGRVNVTRSDDLGMLGVHFNVMADNLECLIEDKIKSQKHTSELEIANKTAELKMLHAQINPHFLFNTLNSIRCLAIINKEDCIARMLESLGALLENGMMKGNENTTIGKEINLLKKYIELQQMRYGKRLKSEFLIEESILICEIPRFMLQPLVENAIIHGLSKKVEGGTITIRGLMKEKMICLEVEDDGIGVNESKMREQNKGQKADSFPNHGVGLANIQERLSLIYGEDCRLEIKSGKDGKGVVASMVFPARVYREEKL